MKITPCQIRHIDGVGYRSGEWGIIAGIYMVTIDSHPEKPRPCYLVYWPDGKTDFCPMEGGYKYEFKGVEV